MRLQLLIEHGGTWIDSTVFCTGRKFEHLLHLPFFVFREHYFSSVAGNWFIVSDPHNPMLTITRDLHYAYWKDYDRLLHYFIYHMFFNMAAELCGDDWEKVPFLSSRPPHEMQAAMYDEYSDEKMAYFAGVSDFHKMTYKVKPEYLTPSCIFRHIAG